MECAISEYNNVNFKNNYSINLKEQIMNKVTLSVAALAALAPVYAQAQGEMTDAEKQAALDAKKAAIESLRQELNTVANFIQANCTDVKEEWLLNISYIEKDLEDLFKDDNNFDLPDTEAFQARIAGAKDGAVLAQKPYTASKELKARYATLKSLYDEKVAQCSSYTNVGADKKTALQGVGVEAIGEQIDGYDLTKQDIVNDKQTVINKINAATSSINNIMENIKAEEAAIANNETAYKAVKDAYDAAKKVFNEQIQEAIAKLPRPVYENWQNQANEKLNDLFRTIEAANKSNESLYADKKCPTKMTENISAIEDAQGEIENVVSGLVALMEIEEAAKANADATLKELQGALDAIKAELSKRNLKECDADITAVQKSIDDLTAEINTHYSNGNNNLSKFNYNTKKTVIKTATNKIDDNNGHGYQKVIDNYDWYTNTLSPAVEALQADLNAKRDAAAAAKSKDELYDAATYFAPLYNETNGQISTVREGAESAFKKYKAETFWRTTYKKSAKEINAKIEQYETETADALAAYNKTVAYTKAQQDLLDDLNKEVTDDAVSLNGSFPVTGETYAQAIKNIQKQIDDINAKVTKAKGQTNTTHKNTLVDASDDAVTYDIATLTKQYKDIKSEYDKNAAINAADAVLLEAQNRIDAFQALIDGVTGDFGNQTDAITAEKTRIQGLLTAVQEKKTDAENTYTKAKNNDRADNSLKQNAAAAAIASLAEVKDALDKIEPDLNKLDADAKAAVANKAAYDAITPVIADAQATLNAVIENPVNTLTHSAAFQYYREQMNKMNSDLQKVSGDTEASYTAITAAADKQTLIDRANAIDKAAKDFADAVLVNENTFANQLADVENLQSTWTSVYNTISEKDLSNEAKKYLKDLAKLQEDINTLKNTTVPGAFAEGKAAAQDEAIQAEIKRISEEVVNIGNKSKENYDANVDATNKAQHDNFLEVYKTANTTFSDAIKTLNEFSAIKNDALQTALDNLIEYHDNIYAYADLLRKLKADENTDYTKYVDDVTDGEDDIYNAKKWVDNANKYNDDITALILKYQDLVNQVAVGAFKNTVDNAKSAVETYENKIATFTYSDKANAFNDVKKVISAAMAAGAIDADGTVHDKRYAVNVDTWMETLSKNLYTMLNADLANACDAEKDKLVKAVTKVYNEEKKAIAGFGEIDNAAYLAKLETLKANTIDKAVNGYYNYSESFIINVVRPYCEAYYGTDAVTNHSDVYQEAWSLSAGNKANLEAYDRMNTALDLLVADFNGVAETVNSLIVAHQNGSVYTILSQIERDLESKRADIEDWKNSGLCDDNEDVFNSFLSQKNRDGFPQRIDELKTLTVQNEVLALNAIIDEVKEEYNQVAKTDLDKVKEYDAKIQGLYDAVDAIKTNFDKKGLVVFEGACGSLLDQEAAIAKINSELNAMYENNQIAEATEAIDSKVANIESALSQADVWVDYNDATRELYLAEVEAHHADFEAIKADYAAKVEASQILFYKDQLLFDLNNKINEIAATNSSLSAEYNKQLTNDNVYAQLKNQLDTYTTELANAYERINGFTHRKSYYGQDVINTTHSNIDRSISSYAEQLETEHTNVTLSYGGDLNNRISGLSSSIYNMEMDACVYEAHGSLYDIQASVDASLVVKNKSLYGGDRASKLQADANDIKRLAGLASSFNADVADNEQASNDIDGNDITEERWGYKYESRWKYLLDDYVYDKDYNQILRPAAWKVISERIAELQGKAEQLAKDVVDLAYIVGDADNDKLVTVNDYSEVRGWILTAKKFEDVSEAKRYAGDVDGDKVFTVADMTSISNLIFNPSAAVARGARAIDAADSELTLSTESEETTIFGKTVRMAVNLSHSVAFTAGQMDITLPQGMKLAGQSLSSRANGHEVLANEIGSGVYRLVASTVENNEFNGRNGALIYLDVEVGSDYNGGNITLDNVLFSDAQANKYTLTSNGPIVPTGIDGIEAASVKERIYSVGGQMMKAVKKGINIIVGENNKTQKVVK